MMSLEFTGKVVAITAAGNGIGRASALLFAEQGASVIVSDIDYDAANSTVETIQKSGGNAKAFHCDVTEPEKMTELVKVAVDHYGRLDVMFNNAGGAQPSAFHETSAQTFDQLMAWNFNSVFHGSLAALKVMLKQGSGCILATSSGAGLGAMPGLAIYGAAKAAVNQLMAGIAAEYGRAGIRANAISAGAMDTPGLRSWTETLPGGHEAYNARQPTGRCGTPKEIAETAVFLSSSHAAFINGAVIPVDGAVHALLANPQ